MQPSTNRFCSSRGESSFPPRSPAPERKNSFFLPFRKTKWNRKKKRMSVNNLSGVPRLRSRIVERSFSLSLLAPVLSLQIRPSGAYLSKCAGCSLGNVGTFPSACVHTHTWNGNWCVVSDVTYGRAFCTLQAPARLSLKPSSAKCTYFFFFFAFHRTIPRALVPANSTQTAAVFG